HLGCDAHLRHQCHDHDAGAGGEPQASPSGTAPGGPGAALPTWGISFLGFLPGAIAGGALGWFLIRPVNWSLEHFFRGFNWVFDRTSDVYGKTVGWCLRLSAIVLFVYAGLIGLTGYGFARIPSGFVPIQDKGYLLVNIQLPDSASLERTLEATAEVEEIALDTPGVAHTVAVPGSSFVLNANSSNYGSMFVILKPFDERRDRSLTGEAIAGRLRA